MPARPVRIANCSGFAGDRPAAIREILAGDPVDVIIGDYLAEVTIAGMVARTLRGRGSGWSEDFLVQLDGNLGEVLDRGIKIVVDAGAFDPAGLADEVRKMAANEGRTVSVAHLEGDNLLDRLDELQGAGCEFTHLDTGRPLSSWPHTPLSANAYLGGWGIVEALNYGADVVICPRVTDASLLVGAAAWWHGWSTDDWDRLAGAVVAGHVIECGPQATGGNFSGFTGMPGMAHPGFPIAEVEDSGASVITKHAGAGGAVTTDTVTAQLLYEIQGPIYLNPDVSVDLRCVELTQEAADRVRITGAAGSPPPETTKVAITAMNGYENAFSVYLTGLAIDAKAALVEEQARRALADSGITITRVDRIGTAAPNPATIEEATVTLRFVGRASDAETLRPAAFFWPVFSTILGNIPGFYAESQPGRASRPAAVMEYWPALVEVARLHPEVVLEEGERRAVPVLPVTAPAPPAPAVDTAPDASAILHDCGPTAWLPLGVVAHARSGDKGGNSNVGIWVDPPAWSWLRAALSVEGFRALFPESRELAVSRHELPRLCAVHFVVHGNLGNGATSNGRLDALGKSVGEYVRARCLQVPTELVRADNLRS